MMYCGTSLQFMVSGEIGRLSLHVLCHVAVEHRHVNGHVTILVPPMEETPVWEMEMRPRLVTPLAALVNAILHIMKHFFYVTTPVAEW